MSFRMLDACSGLGGFAHAATQIWKALEIVAFCEKDLKCQYILAKHWPEVPCVEDIKELKGDSYGTIDLFTAGFPCQPVSVAGKRKGVKDDRWLWPEVIRVIEEGQPRWVVLENVAALVSLAQPARVSRLESDELGSTTEDLVLSQIQQALENLGYEVGIFIIPACAVNAAHRRDRAFLVAYSGRTLRPGVIFKRDIETTITKGIAGAFKRTGSAPGSVQFASDADRERCQEQWEQVSNGTELAGFELLDQVVSNATSEGLQNRRGEALANTNQKKQKFKRCDSLRTGIQFASDANVVHADNGRYRAGSVQQQGASGLCKSQLWTIASGLCGNVDGVSSGLDGDRPERLSGISPEEVWGIPGGVEQFTPKTRRPGEFLAYRADRLRMLGNAIVPQVVKVLLHYIKAIDDLLTGGTK